MDNEQQQEIVKQIDAASYVRIQELEDNPYLIQGNFDTDHLLKIHAYIFQDAPEADADFSEKKISPGKIRPSSHSGQFGKVRKLENDDTEYIVKY